MINYQLLINDLAYNYRVLPVAYAIIWIVKVMNSQAIESKPFHQLCFSCHFTFISTDKEVCLIFKCLMFLFSFVILYNKNWRKIVGFSLSVVHFSLELINGFLYSFNMGYLSKQTFIILVYFCF